MPEHDIDVVIEDQRWEAADLHAIATRAALATLDHLSLGADCEIVVMGCDDARIAALNADFRQKPRPTNVLSWPAQELRANAPGAAPARPLAEEPSGAPIALGDIALSFDTCEQEADAQGKSFANHTCHLIVHGLLHLLGYDHETDADATLMEQQEVEVLATLGIESPY